MTDPMVIGHADPLPPQAHCGCCEGISAGTTPLVSNRPGLHAIAYRVGTHAAFKHAMLARLSAADFPALAHLRTRDSNDFSIALIDAWAVVSDVLTFYQERIANESYIRTATERMSVLELARLIGYRPKPGVAAEAELAFTVEEAAGIEQATVVIGTRVQSIPAPGEEAQTFETVKELVARPEWNALRLRQSRSVKPNQKGDQFAYVGGIANNLNPGDAILLVGPEREGHPDNDNWDFRRLTRVEVDAERDITRIEWRPGLGSDEPYKLPSADPDIYTLRLRCSLFGYNAPHPKLLPDATRTRYSFSTTSEADWSFGFGDSTIDLDSVYAGIAENSWILLSKPSYQEVYRAQTVTEGGRADYAVSGRTTRIVLEGEHLDYFDGGDYRETAVFAQSEPLAFADAPCTSPVWGRTLDLDGAVAGLEEGRTLIVRGKPARLRVLVNTLTLVPDDDPPDTQVLYDGDVVTLLAPPKDVPGSSEKEWRLLTGGGFRGTLTAPSSAFHDEPSVEDAPFVAEVAILAHVEEEDETHSRLVLELPLVNAYDRGSAQVLANVTRATHGETSSEVIGSGDAGRPHQRFTLKGQPLTYVGDDNALGASSTLQLRVDDVLWNEAQSLFERGSLERVYVTDVDDFGRTHIRTGDGVNGARLPTGIDNVQATYRKGTGLAGLVRAGSLQTMMSRPLGLRDVINPVGAEGGADPETRDDARDNAPASVMSLDRTVSLRDYEDFARAFSGIAKALATWSWDRSTRRIYVTVAGPKGAAVPESGVTYKRLLAAIRGAGDPFVAVDVGSYRPVTFLLELKVKVQPDHAEAKVLQGVEVALRGAFGFGERAFGQPVGLGEVIEVVHGIDGVVAVDIDRFHRTKPPNAARIRHSRLLASVPELGSSGQLLPAELLTLDERALVIGAMR